MTERDFNLVVPLPHEGTDMRTTDTALARIEQLPADQTLETINSYLGLLRHTDGHHDRARLANAARRRGHVVDGDLTKVYRRAL